MTGPPPGIVSVGGYRFKIGPVAGDGGAGRAGAILAALPDALGGHRLAGSAADRGPLRRRSDGLGVNPLVSAAFGERRRVHAKLTTAVDGPLTAIRRFRAFRFCVKASLRPCRCKVRSLSLPKSLQKASCKRLPPRARFPSLKRAGAMRRAPLPRSSRLPWCSPSRRHRTKRWCKLLKRRSQPVKPTCPSSRVRARTNPFLSPTPYRFPKTPRLHGSSHA